MTHKKQHIADYPVLFKHLGVEYIVIAPGSRNAPLIKSFYAVFGSNCHSIVDERSAAYFAMGIACKTRKPVVVISTSGTAALNFAPAIAEAYHLGIPLIALTADRPPEWVGHQDNQTINQNNIFEQNVKASFTLPPEVHSESDLVTALDKVRYSVAVSLKAFEGPVHINQPLYEPLYDELPEPNQPEELVPRKFLDTPIKDDVLHIWNNSNKILVVCGQHLPDPILNEALEKISSDRRIAVLAEPIANITTTKTIANADTILFNLKDTTILAPDLVIYYGGQVVSKRLKAFLRTFDNVPFWFIDEARRNIDTFRNLHKIIPNKPSVFFNALPINNSAEESSYQQLWQEMQEEIQQRIKTASDDLPFTDITTIKKLSGLIPSDAILFTGNSSIVRYFNIFCPQVASVYANRGTSGIDGCLSTASGIATVSDKNIYAVLGDLSFLYDSNGLWNKQLPDKLKIIVLNNSGGGIFSLIDGPKSTQAFQFFETRHNINISKLCEAYSVEYISNDYPDLLQDDFKKLTETNNACVLEIKTPIDENAGAFKEFIRSFKLS